MRGFWPFVNLSTMNRNLQRITAALLLGSYGLAVTVSGAFHTHPDPVCHSCAPDRAEYGHASSRHTHEYHEPVGCPKHDGPSVADVANSCPLGINSHGDGCAVCSFLAQKPVRTTSPVEAACTYLTQAPGHLKAVARVEEPFSAIWSRGPPPVA